MASKRKAEDQDACTDLVEDLQARITALEAELEEKDEEYEDKINEFDEKMEEIDILKEIVQEKTEECVDLQMQLDDAEKENARCEKLLETSDDRMDRYVKILKDKLNYKQCVACGDAELDEDLDAQGRCHDCNEKRAGRCF